MKTKILVLHLKEILYTAAFALLGILLVVLIVVLFLPSAKEKTTVESAESLSTDQLKYKKGDYDANVTLGDQSLTLRVTVTDSSIEAISFIDLSEECKTMYSLLISSLEDLTKQILDTQSLDEIVYPDERKYTSMVLLDAIQKALNAASQK